MLWRMDSRSADAIISIFDRLLAEKKTIVMVTHDPSLTERTSRNLIISDGELVDEVKGAPADDAGKITSRWLERRDDENGTV